MDLEPVVPSDPGTGLRDPVTMCHPETLVVVTVKIPRTVIRSSSPGRGLNSLFLDVKLV